MHAPIPTIEQTYAIEPVESLTTHPDNPRKGDVDMIGKSIEANGFYGSVIAQTSTRHVLAGNHRLIAARARGVEHLPVIWVDVDDDRARRILAVDNRASDAAEWDDERLAALLTGFDHDYAGTGFTEHELQMLLAGDGDPAALALEPQQLSIIVECDDEQQQHDLLDAFAAEGLRVRPLMM
jgi:ParB-like chromosome segregation protein Spo0J